MRLDPRNVNLLEAAAVTYSYMRDYRQAKPIFDRIIALEPKNIANRLWRARWSAFARADLRPVQDVLGKDFTANPAVFRTDGAVCFAMALWGRDPGAAGRVL